MTALFGSTTGTPLMRLVYSNFAMSRTGVSGVTVITSVVMTSAAVNMASSGCFLKLGHIKSITARRTALHGAWRPLQRFHLKYSRGSSPSSADCAKCKRRAMRDGNADDPQAEIGRLSPLFY